MRDYTPLLRQIALEASTLRDVERLAREAGFHAFEAVIELPRRVEGVGARIRCVVIYAGARLVGVALRADGVEPSALSKVSSLLGVPVIAVEEAGA